MPGRVEALLDGCQTGLLQPDGLSAYEGRINDIREGRATPQREGFAQGLRGGGVVAGRGVLAAAGQQHLEMCGIDVAGLDLQQVAVRARQQHVAAARLPQRSAQPGDVHSQGVQRAVGAPLAPQVVHQSLGGHHLVGGQQQQRQQCSFPRAT